MTTQPFPKKSYQESYQQYIFSTPTDHERLQIQHKLSKSGFMQKMERILDEYGLMQRLVLAANEGAKLSFLDVGCGEGFYLHDLAEVLEKHEILAATQLVGLDVDVTAISTANQYSQISNPPRPYLTFRLADLNAMVQLEPKPSWDLIYALFVLEHLSDARQYIQYLYHSLKPGGILLLRDAVFQDVAYDPHGLVMPHSAMTPIFRELSAFILSKNAGTDVARASAGWLEELGAEILEVEVQTGPIGGTSSEGRDMIRNMLLMMRSSLPLLIARNVVTKNQFDETMQTLFKELSLEMVGSASVVDTLVRKPL